MYGYILRCHIILTYLRNPQQFYPGPVITLVAQYLEWTFILFHISTDRFKKVYNFFLDSSLYVYVLTNK